MKAAHGLLIAFLLVGLWIVMDHLRTPRLHFETVRDLPAVREQVVSQPASASQMTGSIQPVIQGRVNLNTANLQDLIELPRVGVKLAQRIIDGRPYRTLQDLDQVKGIGEKMLKSLEPLITL